MNEKSAIEFAAWLEENEPALFNELNRTAVASGAGLAGVSDWFKSVGSTLSSGVSNVAKFLTSGEGFATVAALGTAYMTTKAQGNVLQTQMNLAQAGMSPAPIQNAIGANGQIVPIDSRTGQPVIDLSRYQPPFLQQYMVPMLIGGGILIAFFMLRK